MKRGDRLRRSSSKRCAVAFHQEVSAQPLDVSCAISLLGVSSNAQRDVFEIVERGNADESAALREGAQERGTTGARD